MEEQKKRNRKLVATTLSAAVAASAITPAVTFAAEDTLTDVEGSYFEKEIKYLHSKDIISGFGDGTFGPEKLIQRDQAAAIIANAFGFEPDGTIDFEDVPETAFFYDQIDATAPEIFGGDHEGKFNMSANLTREDAAAVIVKALQEKGYELEPGADTPFTDLNATQKSYVEIAYANGIVNGTSETTFSPSDNVQRGEFAAMIYRALEITGQIEEEEGLIVESVSAITPTEAQVTVNAELDEISVNDVEVVNQDGEKQYIKSVEIVDAGTEVQTLAASKSTTLKIEFYDALKSGDTYTVSVKVGEETVSTELEFEIAEVAEIQLEEQLIPNNGSLEYKVLDANGLDITSITKVNVSSDKDVFTASEGKVESRLANGFAFVELSYTTKDGEVVKSDRVKVTAEAAKPVEFGSDWSLVDPKADGSKGDSPDYDADDYEQDTTLNMGDTKYIDVTLVDQFGKEFDVESATVEFETLDASVAIVDKVSGKVTPRKEGTALVRATLKDGNKSVATKTLEFKVVAKAELAGVEVEKDSVEVVKDGDSVQVKVTPVDQFGNKIASKITAKSSDTEVVTVQYDKNQSVKEHTLTLTGVEKGTAIVTVKAGDFEQTISVNVLEAGEVVDYKVEGFVKELFVKKDEDKELYDEMTISVKPVDANGLVVPNEDVPGVTIEVEDKNGDKVEGNFNNGNIAVSDLTDAEGPFTVTVKVGTLTVFSDTFKVTDNREVPKYNVTSNKLTVNSSVTIEKAIEKVLDFGNIGGTVAVGDVDYVSSNEQVIKDTGEGTSTTSNGTSTIYVDTVNVTVTGGNYEGTYELELKGEKFNVTVDVTNPSINTEASKAELNDDGDLVLTVKANDENLYALEVDHSHGKYGKYAVEETDANGEGTGNWFLKGTDYKIPALPEFTIYASEDNPYGSADDKKNFLDNDVEVKYDANSQTWTITFAADSDVMKLINNENISNGAIEFYLVAKDSNGNTSGDMDGKYVTVSYHPAE